MDVRAMPMCCQSWISIISNSELICSLLPCTTEVSSDHHVLLTFHLSEKLSRQEVIFVVLNGHLRSLNTATLTLCTTKKCRMDIEKVSNLRGPRDISMSNERPIDLYLCMNPTTKPIHYKSRMLTFFWRILKSHLVFVVRNSSLP